MDFASAYLFNKQPEDMRRVGALGGRARARNLRLRKARQASVPANSAGRTRRLPPRPSGASMPCAPGWLVPSVAYPGGRADEGTAGRRAGAPRKQTTPRERPGKVAFRGLPETPAHREEQPALQISIRRAPLLLGRAIHDYGVLAAVIGAEPDRSKPPADHARNQVPI